jgi:predicted Zn-dependent protease
MGARFTDGRSAAVRDAGVVVSADGLRITPVGGEETHWPAGAIGVANPGEVSLVLRREPDDGARLTLFGDEAEAAREAFPSLFDRGRARARGFRLVAGLVAMAGAIAAAVFIGWPLALPSIARALPAQAESRFGEIAREQIFAAGNVCREEGDLAGIGALENLARRLDRAAGGPPRPLDLTVIDTGFPNAFALPGGQIVITSELIAMADHPDQIAGVIAHELAHIRERHVLEAYLRHAGIGVMVDVVLGGGGLGQVLAGSVANAGAMRYDRETEAQADRLGLAYMEAAGFDPGGLSQFLARMAAEEELHGGSTPEIFRSHPETRARAQRAAAAARPGRAPALSAEAWRSVRAICAADG